MSASEYEGGSPFGLREPESVNPLERSARTSIEAGGYKTGLIIDEANRDGGLRAEDINWVNFYYRRAAEDTANIDNGWRRKPLEGQISSSRKGAAAQFRALRQSLREKRST